MKLSEGKQNKAVTGASAQVNEKNAISSTWLHPTDSDEDDVPSVGAVTPKSKPKGTPSKKPSRQPCDICGKSFTLLSLHRKVHFPAQHHHCAICKVSYPLAANMATHLKTAKHIEKAKEHEETARQQNVTELAAAAEAIEKIEEEEENDEEEEEGQSGEKRFKETYELPDESVSSLFDGILDKQVPAAMSDPIVSAASIRDVNATVTTTTTTAPSYSGNVAASTPSYSGNVTATSSYNSSVPLPSSNYSRSGNHYTPAPSFMRSDNATAAAEMAVANQERKVTAMIPPMETIKNELNDLQTKHRNMWAVLASLESEYERENRLLEDLKGQLQALQKTAPPPHQQQHMCTYQCRKEYEVLPCGHVGCELWKSQIVQSRICPICGKQVARVVQNIL